jgi:hypothetical protein
VSTHNGGAAGLDIGKHPLLARREPRAIILQVRDGFAAKNVGHF